MVPRRYLCGWVAACLGPKVHYIVQSYPNTAVFYDPKNNKVKHKNYAESFSKITHTRRGFVGSFTGPINKIWPHKICSKKCSKNKFELPKITFPSLCTRTNAHLSRLRRLREDYGETCVSLPPLECLTNKEKRNIQIKLNSKKIFTKHTRTL